VLGLQARAVVSKSSLKRNACLCHYSPTLAMKDIGLSKLTKKIIAHNRHIVVSLCSIAER
jgi:hypothetical protein